MSASTIVVTGTASGFGNLSVRRFAPSYVTGAMIAVDGGALPTI